MRARGWQSRSFQKFNFWPLGTHACQAVLPVGALPNERVPSLVSSGPLGEKNKLSIVRCSSCVCKLSGV